MRRKLVKLLVFISTIAVLTTFLSGCVKPYDKPEFVTISPSQTAFLIPLVGDTKDQGAFQSEELLAKAKVATKEVQIPHRWVQTGRWGWEGEYRKSASLIVVERKPETREWTEKQNTGTSTKDDGITAESKESIGFMARASASAQIDEVDATKFLYRYNNKSLADIMDTEIRTRIESKFVEQCSKLTLEEILLNKEAIMKVVRDDVVPYFKDRGINITVIGLKGEFTYLNPEIQASIDRKFKSAQDLISQDNENKKAVNKAKADAEAVQIQAATIQSQIKLKELENQAKWIEKWDGKMPQYTGDGANFLFNAK